MSPKSVFERQQVTPLCLLGKVMSLGEPVPLMKKAGQRSAHASNSVAVASGDLVEVKHGAQVCLVLFRLLEDNSLRVNDKTAASADLTHTVNAYYKELILDRRSLAVSFGNHL